MRDWNSYTYDADEKAFIYVGPGLSDEEKREKLLKLKGRSNLEKLKERLKVYKNRLNYIIENCINTKDTYPVTAKIEVKKWVLVTKKLGKILKNEGEVIQENYAGNMWGYPIECPFLQAKVLQKIARNDKLWEGLN